MGTGSLLQPLKCLVGTRTPSCLCHKEGLPERSPQPACPRPWCVCDPRAGSAFGNGHSALAVPAAAAWGSSLAPPAAPASL